MSKRIWAILVLAVLTLAVSVTGARADDIIASSTGLTSPTQTLTFDEVVLAQNAPVTTEYAAFGVTFAPNVYYTPQTGFGNVQGGSVGNYIETSGGGTASISPVTLSFSSALTGAAFSFEADGTPYLFQAFLGGTLVDSFTATIGSGTTSDYYGFNNITFDSIVITDLNPTTACSIGGPCWLLDNLQTTPTAAPEPGTFALLGLGTLGLVAVKLSKK